VADKFLLWFEALLHRLAPLEQVGDVEARQLGDIPAVDEEVQRLAVESVAVTCGAHCARKELAAPLLGFGGGVVLLLEFDIFYQSLV
jgi:hypothetical protein